MKIIVGVSGSSGALITKKLMEALSEAGVEMHLVASETGKKVFEHETGGPMSSLEDMATKTYASNDMFASIASGSFKTDGMVVVPCSMKTLAGIANGYSENLLLRAADVMLKERRKLILVARETPLSLVHIRNMEKATQAGAVILPPMMTFYSRADSADEMARHITGKIMDNLGLEYSYERWGSGTKA